MGWTGLHREPGMSDLDFFRSEFPSIGPRIIDGATYRGAFYGALRCEDGGREYVTALVILLQRSRGYMNFHYKEMDEGMGPAEDRCPERILRLLSPVEECGYGESSEQYAREWRQRCETNLAARKAKPALRLGSVVRLAQPVAFSNGEEIDTFAIVGSGRQRKVVRACADGDRWLPGYTRYSVNLRNYDYEIVGTVVA